MFFHACINDVGDNWRQNNKDMEHGSAVCGIINSACGSLSNVNIKIMKVNMNLEEINKIANDLKEIFNLAFNDVKKEIMFMWWIPI